MKTFREKTVVITGAGSGIGRALAAEFGKLGAKVAINDRDEDTLADTVSFLKDMNVEHVFAADFDVSNKIAMEQFASDIEQRWGNAHVIINNAGIEGRRDPAYLTTEEDYRTIMDVNFFGVVNGCQAFLPQLVANNEGAVVNISSIFGLIGMMNYSGYSASKFAVRGYTEALMVEFHKSPITIHCVHPGGIKTNISDSEVAKKQLITPPEDLARYIIQSIKKKRSRIVYGNGAFKVWLASKLVPLNMLKGILWKEFYPNASQEAYRSFISSS